MDIKLTSSGLAFGNGLVLTESLDEKVAQRLVVRLRTYVNTWFLDLDFGVDWFGRVFGKGRSRLAVDSLLRTEILKEIYVDRIISYQSTLIGRQYSATFSVKLISITAPNIVTLSLLVNEDGVQITDENGNPLLTNL